MQSALMRSPRGAYGELKQQFRVAANTALYQLNVFKMTRAEGLLFPPFRCRYAERNFRCSGSASGGASCAQHYRRSLFCHWRTGCPPAPRLKARPCLACRFRPVLKPPLSPAPHDALGCAWREPHEASSSAGVSAARFSHATARRLTVHDFGGFRVILQRYRYRQLATQSVSFFSE